MQELRRLSRRRSARSAAGRYLIDGPVLLAEALAAGVELHDLFVEPAARSHPTVVAAERSGVVVRDVQEGALARVLDVVTPQAVVVVASQRRTSLEDVLGAAIRAARPVLVLVGLQDPGNAGTLVRVAEAAGCAGVVLTEHSVDLHNPKTVRATAGALFRLPIAEGVVAPDLLDAARSADVPTWATVRADGTDVDAAELVGTCALLIGSEAHGLPAEVLDRVDGRLSIPMDGDVESLNAAVAGALVAFEAARQRRAVARGASAGGRDGEPSRGPTGSLGHDVPGRAADGATAGGAGEPGERPAPARVGPADQGPSSEERTT